MLILISACLSFQSFFETHQAPAAERTVEQCCENILLNAAWLKRDADDIHKYLLQRKAPPVWLPNSDLSLSWPAHSLTQISQQIIAASASPQSREREFPEIKQALFFSIFCDND